MRGEPRPLDILTKIVEIDCMAELSSSTPRNAKRARNAPRVLAALAWSVAAICVLPMLAVAIAALSGGTGTVGHLIETVLPRYAGNTLMLVLLVSLGTFLVGVGAAWLVTMTRFPGVRIFEIALVLRP